MSEVASYFPSALWYKEWKEHRGKVVLAFCLFALQPVGNVLLLWLRMLSPHPGQYPLQAFWQQFHQSLTVSAGHSDVLGLFTVMVMPGVLLATERSRGTLWYTLSTPVRRDSWLRTKFLFGLFVIIGSFSLLTLWEAVVAGFAPQAVGVGEIVQWYVAMIAIHGATYAVAFVAAVCVTSVIGTVISTLALFGFPYWINMMLITMGSGPYHQTPLVRAYIGSQIARLTPLNTTAEMSFQNVFLYWYLFLIPVGYVAGQALFRRIRAEHFESLLTFPKLWLVVFTGVSVLLGSLVADIVGSAVDMVAPSAQTTVFITVFVIVSAVIWFLLYTVAAMRTRRSMSRDLS